MDIEGRIDMTGVDGVHGELARRVRRYVRLRRLNGFLADATIWGVIITSFVLTVIIATNPAYTFFNTGIKWAILLAPLPAVFTSLRLNLGFTLKTAWFSEKATRLDTVRLRLNSNEIAVSQAVTDMVAIDVDMEEKWREYVLRKLELEGHAKG